MIIIDNESILGVTHKTESKMKDGCTPILFMEDFVNKVLPTIEKENKRTYPYEVKLPKSNDAMLKGDFTPAQVLTIKEPIKGYKGLPIWSGDSTNGVRIRSGYKNGDSRYVNDFVMGQRNIHSMLGGSTGQGKSVTLNAIIWAMTLEYAPWELHLYLSDPKIVEFKPIATTYKMPHVRMVAATEDVDYFISMLEELENEMKTRQQVFAAAGKLYKTEIKDIAKFRRITGLTLPQIFIIADEFQAGLENANNKQKGILEALYDSFGRLGRAAGVHMILASQEIGSAIPAKLFKNVTGRMAVGCFGDVSTKILGNDAAKNNMNKPGRLIQNDNSDAADSKHFNVLIRVPYMEGTISAELAKSTVEAARAIGYKPELDFYDEKDVMDETAFRRFMENPALDKNSIYLGEVSSVCKDDVKAFRLQLTGKDIENICCISSETNTLKRFHKMVMYNIGRMKCSNLVFNANTSFDEDDFEYLEPLRYEDGKSFSDSKFFSDVAMMINCRNLMLEIDKEAFRSPKQSLFEQDGFEEMYNAVIKKINCKQSQLAKTRAALVYWNLTKMESYKRMFGLNTMTVQVASEARCNVMGTILTMYEKYGLGMSKTESSNLPRYFCWVYGLDRIIGLGRDHRSQCETEFVKLLQDAATANVRFICSTSKFEDLGSPDNFRWYLLDNIASNIPNRLKCSDDYPATKAAVLAVLYDTINKMKPIVKFKKMLFDGEPL
ncbi:FtsK/SpoIIIE domain-containing protein [Acetivibrio ethanolgignens]|uniref:FtsK domain-containing protein n=1 Tax=Acetivibrio ethanolgignens TaxID=290052 RepID=A0A0V8QC04_9FIRM|nr:FtsK/SpoIIIE domain-containing protein [Acetivibrio ethanolgignens]KSV57907.1 hypothetical protein ASU35_14945 [Acetivibrio ethanolgignens]